MCDQGIVVSVIKYGDDDAIVSVFFAKEGIVPFMVKMSHGRYSNRLRALLMPLNIVEVDYELRKNKQLQRLKELAQARSWGTDSPVGRNEGATPIVKITIKMFLAEVLRAVLRHEKENEELFGFLVGSLRWLENATDGIGNFHLVFLTHLLKYLGYNPTYDNEFGSLRKFLECDYDSMSQHQMNHIERTDCLDKMLCYYRLHVPEFPEIKSLDVLKEI